MKELNWMVDFGKALFCLSVAERRLKVLNVGGKALFPRSSFQEFEGERVKA